MSCLDPTCAPPQVLWSASREVFRGPLEPHHAPRRRPGEPRIQDISVHENARWARPHRAIRLRSRQEV